MSKSVQPLEWAVQAKPHRPVYRMHRYFARRPYSVFAELIKHYSDPSDVVLDPFCGGGVTLVEGLLQGRRVVGFDTNPLAAFITRMELSGVDLDDLREAQSRVCLDFHHSNEQLFATTCRRCDAPALAEWFEYSALLDCGSCSRTFSIARANKEGIGRWACPYCGRAQRFSPDAQTTFEPLHVFYSCNSCGCQEIAEADAADVTLSEQVEDELRMAEDRGLWIPDEAIPDCNMQRESALFKKGICNFRQLFSARHLLALGHLRRVVLQQPTPLQEWLLFAFSSTLRYTNRMVTRNPSWRGNRPLEWAKPGFWLPPVHLEANVLTEFSRRCDAVWRGKRDYLSKLTTEPKKRSSANGVVQEPHPAFHVSVRSASDLPLGDESVDVIITDPPYGSYVHYADLCNFWAVWLPEIEGLGRTIDDAEEAVIARKNFPGAKKTSDYQRILESCFAECARVLKMDGYMVLTFNNREPRAWAALLVAALRAGFQLPANGLLFQDGVSSYRHTAQSRRSGSVIGDFIFSFRKSRSTGTMPPLEGTHEEWIPEAEFVAAVEEVLEDSGPLTPDTLLVRLYTKLYPRLLSKVQSAVSQGDDAAVQFLNSIDAVSLLDSHRRGLLEKHFKYEDGKWFPKVMQ